MSLGLNSKLKRQNPHIHVDTTDQAADAEFAFSVKSIGFTKFLYSFINLVRKKIVSSYSRRTFRDRERFLHVFLEVALQINYVSYVVFFANGCFGYDDCDHAIAAFAFVVDSQFRIDVAAQWIGGAAPQLEGAGISAGLATQPNDLERYSPSHFSDDQCSEMPLNMTVFLNDLNEVQILLLLYIEEVLKIKEY
uniref:Uncharacterized protein n=1 Tax=Romanomermis culicivorax TaxID=13658 RepID=A0A915JTV5_ROMCU